MSYSNNKKVVIRLVGLLFEELQKETGGTRLKTTFMDQKSMGVSIILMKTSLLDLTTLILTEYI